MKITITHFFVFLILSIMVSCTKMSDQTPVVIELNEGWTFAQSGTEHWMPASVPGTVHTDLMANEVIDDPHYRLNENDVQWIEKEDWIYKTAFDVEESLLLNNRLELHFDGLDTYADVYLNDNLILEADNMFVGWQVDVKEFVQAGRNELKIYFHSPVQRGLTKLQALDYLIPSINEQAPVNERTSVFTRKAPFHYGWDWGPRLVTSGVWRPVKLKAWHDAIIQDVYIETRAVSKELASLSGKATVDVEVPGRYTLSLLINGKSSGVKQKLSLDKGINEFNFDFDIKNPSLWWTNGLGEAYMYDFTFSLEGVNLVADRYNLAYGVRTLHLVQEPDEAGRSFYFELNGVPVFMKGANVIPSETLTPSVTPERYKRLIQDAVDANMNMLRVWGGAIYEEDYFYELCNRNGILIWQDFMFACNLQPGDEAHLDNIRKEAEYNVKRLRNNACLALWCGNNENLHGWFDWGWKDMYAPDVREFMWRTYERIFYEILPEVVAKYDPKNSYWASSPSSHGNGLADRKSGDEHDWTIWFGEKPFSAYGENLPRFVSEYGIQAFPGMHTIRDFSVEGDWDMNSQVMRHRQRGAMSYIAPGFDGNDMIKRYMGRYYNVPDSFEHFVYVSQLLHAKCYRTAIEAHRRNMPHCMGSLYWQLNDSWPTISWATVDYYGRWKAAHYAVRKANEEIIVSVEVKDDHARIFVVSDRLTSVGNARLHVRLMDFSGREIHSINQPVKIEANTSAVVMESGLQELKQHFALNSVFAHIELKEGAETLADNIVYFCEPKEMVLPSAKISSSIEKTTDGYTLTFTSSVLVRNLFVDTPYADVFASDNYFDLVPGKPKTIRLVTNRVLHVDDDIFWLSLNDLQ
ncbi:beta-mannosidase [Alkaliflexus imshenetskii]|uniref:beta-mannosidase n=1 Tax=Alkaliflexus imshenetskii TaxID=286730 RepID=UPI0004B809C8|nr:glycoside hydrolase family 2 protein [Alkaliflexus imshenetskii]